MIALDYTVFAQIVFFLVFCFVLSRVLFRPFLGVLEERKRHTEGVRSESASILEEAERLKSQYEEALANAHEEGLHLKEAVQQAAMEAREELLSLARADAAHNIQSAREEIQRQIKKEREVAAKEARELSQAVTEKILGRKI